MNSPSGLFFILLRQQWKAALRSSYWQKNVAINVILGIGILYFLINLVILGLFLGRIIQSAFPGADPASALSGILFYYFIADFFMRFLLQPSPVIQIVPYLHLPLKRNSIPYIPRWLHQHGS